MVICHCNRLNCKAIDAAVEAGATCWKEVYAHHGCSTKCGKCVGTVCERLAEIFAIPEADVRRNVRPSDMPLVSAS